MKPINRELIPGVNYSLSPFAPFHFFNSPRSFSSFSHFFPGPCAFFSLSIQLQSWSAANRVSAAERCRRPISQQSPRKRYKTFSFCESFETVSRNVTVRKSRITYPVQLRTEERNGAQSDTYFRNYAVCFCVCPASISLGKMDNLTKSRGEVCSAFARYSRYEVRQIFDEDPGRKRTRGGSERKELARGQFFSPGE